MLIHLEEAELSILHHFPSPKTVLSLPPEKVTPVFAELTGNGYLEILEENGAFGLHLKG